MSLNQLSSDYLLKVARGEIAGASLFTGFGERSISGIAYEDVWVGPTAKQPIPPSTGIQMEVVSDSIVDSDSLGTGLQQVELHYIDAAGAEGSEIILLDGTTPVNTVTTDIRFVQCVHVWVGTAPVGNISVRDTAGTIIYSYIPIGKTRCASSMRMVPAGKVFYVTSAIGGSASGASKQAVLRLETNAIDGDIVSDGTIFFPQGTSVTQDNSTNGTFSPPLPVPPLGIIKATGDTSGSTFVSVSYFGWIEDITV